MKKTKENIDLSSPVCYVNSDELREEYKDKPEAKKPINVVKDKT